VIIVDSNFPIRFVCEMQNKNNKIYTVSQINSLIKIALEQTLPSRLIVKGEITDWKLQSSSGHYYFKLKDENSILSCAIWKNNFRKIKFQPGNGLAVLAKGFINVFTPKGYYTFNVDELFPAGQGALQLAFEQMVKKLREEGLFDEAHKKKLPAYPERIGIITSETGAAVHDIVDSIHSRWPCVKLFLYSVPVQGEGAAKKISAALKDINKRNKQLKLDVLIVGRGGGSLEDLWAFNEEVLARAIFASNIPVISAVGHEVDTTIADIVADARASTPTKAGVVAVPDMWEVLEQLLSIESRLAGQIKSGVLLARQNLETILARALFRNPLLLVRNAEQQLDELAVELIASMQKHTVNARRSLSEAYEKVVGIEPHRLLGKKTLDLNNMLSRANTGINRIVNNLKMQLTAATNRLEGLNPKAVLVRGYSITTNKKTGLLIRTSEDIQVGDYMTTELAGENLIESKVTKK
jgi:exodeoxyribonuclease VII large subunit